MFGAWANSNPDELRRIFRLKRVDTLGTTQFTAPQGSVLVWNAGQCGFSSEHGHIEIVVRPGHACSDFCGNVATCSTPWIYMPVK